MALAQKVTKTGRAVVGRTAVPRKKAATGKKTDAKKKTTKKVAARKSTAAASANHRSTSVEERHSMIAEAAYYKALQRSGAGSDPAKDWFEAESEIDAEFLMAKKAGK
jgi:hypothetical protein